MKTNLSDVTLVLDRSGSMESVRGEAEKGVNAFIEDQKKQDGECLLTLVQFDTEYEFVHEGVPIADVPPYKLVPRGMTALLDAVGQAINQTGERISLTPENDRPGLVVFVILTDGHENSSHEFTKTQIQEMVRRQTDTYKWQFTFLGADSKAFDEAAGMGIRSAAAYDKGKTPQAFAGASGNLSRMRSSSASGQSVSSSYTDQERKEMS